MAALEPDVEFFGLRVPPNTTVSVDDAEGDRRDDDDESSEGGDGADGIGPVVEGIALVHATQVALGPNPAPGRHTVMAVRASDSGKSRAFPIGTLEAGRVEMFSVDLMFSCLQHSGEFALEGGSGDVSFMHTGASDVYITGYKTVTSLLDDERGYSDGEEEDESDGEFTSSDEDDDEAPVAVPLVKGRRGGSPPPSSSGDESSSSDEESDDDLEEVNARVRENLGVMLRRSAPVTPAGGRRRGKSDDDEGESDDDESESDDDSDDDESESDSEDEEDEEPARGGKRPAFSAAEPSNKKAKTGGGDDASSYARALREFISSRGPTKLGVLGSQVKRPSSLPKLSTFLASRRDFKVDGEQRVSLVG